MIQIFVSAQEELSKIHLLFQSYDNRFAKINSSEMKGNENLGDMVQHAEQSKTQKNEHSKQLI